MKRSVSDNDMHARGARGASIRAALAQRVAASRDVSRHMARSTMAMSRRLAATTASSFTALVANAAPSHLTASVSSLGRRSFKVRR